MGLPLRPRRRAGFAVLRSAGLLWLAAPMLTLAQPCEKSLRWSDDPPFSMRLANQQPGGMQIDVAVEALRRMGCTTRLVEMPFARALTELQAGRLDMVTGAFPRPERQLYAYFTAPIALLQSRTLLYVRSDEQSHWRFKSLLDLPPSGFKLGVQPSVVYGDDFALLMRNRDYAATVLKVSNRRRLWQMLALGRIDGVIADEFTAQIELTHLNLLDQIVAMELVVSAEAGATAFSKASNDPDFVARYNATVQAMRQEGQIEAIRQRYLPRRKD